MSKEKLLINEICCLIITYNPDEGLLKQINILEKQVDRIIIVDNNSIGNGFEIISEIGKNKEFVILRNSENLGIATALNQGINEARNMNYDWVITFDQDSMPFNNIINIISEVYQLYPEKNRIGAIGVNFSATNNASYYSFSNSQKYIEKDYLITSGCLLSVNAFTEIGGFREDFFIDNVDLEYSLRLRKNGKISLITKEWGMKHKAGDPKIRKFSIFKMVSSNHNSFRRYYMARNHILLSKEYFIRFPYFIAKLNYFFILSLLKIVFAENDKKNKIINSLRGIKDGLFYPSKKRDILNNI